MKNYLKLTFRRVWLLCALVATFACVVVSLQSCTAAKTFLWDAATDVGMQALEKRYPDFTLNIPLKSVDDVKGYRTPLGFLNFYITQKQDTLLVYAVPQYATIGDSIKAVGRKILIPKKKNARGAL